MASLSSAKRAGLSSVDSAVTRVLGICRVFPDNTAVYIWTSKGGEVLSIMD